MGDGSDLQPQSLTRGLMLVGMYGVLKGFMEVALADYTGDCPAPVIPRKLRDVMRKRGELLRLTADFGRPYKCIVRSLRSYQLDDWLHFLETFSLFVLQRDVLPPLMQSRHARGTPVCTINACLESMSSAAAYVRTVVCSNALWKDRA